MVTLLKAQALAHTLATCKRSWQMPGQHGADTSHWNLSSKPHQTHGGERPRPGHMLSTMYARLCRHGRKQETVPIAEVSVTRVPTTSEVWRGKLLSNTQVLEATCTALILPQ